MEDNDIGLTVHKHVACMFEGLLMTAREEVEEERRRSIFFRRSKDESQQSEEDYVRRTMRTWKVNELPMKSLIHMTTNMGLSVEVYTYYDPIFVPHIESWLSRKGASVQVWAYYDLNELREDFKYNRDVHTLFTPSQEEAQLLGMRATVVLPDGTFGI